MIFSSEKMVESGKSHLWRNKMTSLLKGHEDYIVTHTIIGGDNKIRWWSSDRSEELNVYAWKEIVLPKEIEEK